MKRLLGIAGAILVVLLFAAPVVLAANPMPQTGRVLISSDGDLTIPAGEHADVVVVVNGTATIQGEVNTIVVVDGAANLLGGRAETVVAVRSPVEIGPGSVVLGDVMTVESVVHQSGTAQVQGHVTDLAAGLVGLGIVLAPALLLLWIGFGLAMVVAGLLLAGLASSQVRAAEAIISREPIMTLATGIVALFAFPIASFLLIATIVGAPLGIGILLGAWPVVGLLGYLVAGIWIGETVLRRTSPGRVRERPYAAAVVGLVILGLLSIVPILAIVVMIASLFGIGSVSLLALRALRSHPVSEPMAAASMPAPLAG